MAICYNSGIQRKVDMNIRVRAAVKTVVILGYVALIAVAVQLILKYTPPEMIAPALATIAIGAMVYLLYTIVLGQVRFEEILKSINSKG
jgi:membrane protein YdbS with pleckstrin-like domain